MGKNRGLKIISIIGLCLGVASLAIGFANFSSLLKIESGASVGTSGGNFKVEFSTQSGSASTTGISVVANPSNLTVETPTINNTNQEPEISNLGATFTQPGQSVTYTFYSRNVGEYTAFLNSIALEGVKSCTAINGTSEEVKAVLCAGLTMSITVGEGTNSISIPAGGTYGEDISGHPLIAGGSEKIVLTINYAPENAYVGDIEASFGTIKLNYNGVD